MTNDQWGKLFSILNALTWAIALVLFRKAGDRVSPLALNLFKNTVGFVLIAATVGIGIGLSLGDDFAVPYELLDVRGRKFWFLVASGFVGIALADTLFFYGLNLAGVGLTAIVDCLYTPFIILFGWVMLGEGITPIEAVGGLMILSAVAASTHAKPTIGHTHRQLVAGIVMLAAALALMAAAIVFVRPILKGSSDFWTAGIRLAAGMAGLLLLAPLRPGLGELRRVFTPSRDWWVLVPAAFFGAYLAMLLWVAGNARTQTAAVAAMLNQCSSIFAIVFAVAFLREPLTWLRGATLVIALGGVTLISTHEWLEDALSKLWQTATSS